MTIFEKLAYLLTTKTTIKNTIEARGVSVGDIPFRQYAGKINLIKDIPFHKVEPKQDSNYPDITGISDEWGVMFIPSTVTIADEEKPVNFVMTGNSTSASTNKFLSVRGKLQGGANLYRFERYFGNTLLECPEVDLDGTFPVTISDIDYVPTNYDLFNKTVSGCTFFNMPNAETFGGLIPPKTCPYINIPKIKKITGANGTMICNVVNLPPQNLFTALQPTTETSTILGNYSRGSTTRNTQGRIWAEISEANGNEINLDKMAGFEIRASAFYETNLSDFTEDLYIYANRCKYIGEGAFEFSAPQTEINIHLYLKDLETIDGEYVFSLRGSGTANWVIHIPQGATEIKTALLNQRGIYESNIVEDNTRP